MGNDNKDKEKQENENQEPENLKPEDQESSGEESSEADFSESESSGEEAEEELTAPESTSESIPETPPEAASASQPDEAEEFEKTTVKQVSIKWGLISGVISIAMFLLFVVIDMVGEQSTSWLGIIPFIVILVLAHKEFKNEGDGYMSYGQGLGIGIFVSFISSIVSGGFQIIYMKLIDTSFYENLMDKMELKWEEEGMTDQQIDAAKGFMETFQNPLIGFFIGILFAVFFGFIVSLIVSAFTKNANPQAEI